MPLKKILIVIFVIAGFKSMAQQHDPVHGASLAKRRGLESHAFARNTADMPSAREEFADGDHEWVGC